MRLQICVNAVGGLDVVEISLAYLGVEVVLAVATEPVIFWAGRE